MKSNLNQLRNWVLLPSLLLLTFCCRKNTDNSPVIEKDINITGFNKVYAGERFNVTVTRGTGFSVKAKGPSNSVNDIDWGVANNILDIEYNHYQSNRPRVDITITLPMLVQLNLSGAAAGTINGFNTVPNVVRTVLSGAAKCLVNGTGVNTQIEISGASELTINGTTESLYGNISGAGKLEAYNLASTEVDLSVSGGSEAKVKVSDRLFLEATGGSRVYYKGSPAVKNIQTSGGGQVIQQ
ncbi:MAG TPA: head GIN domain-containing protein [Chitinophagaceae bacterium]|nr:head GIN domain-containing protein [Chitinophagaceae bacterium]